MAAIPCPCAIPLPRPRAAWALLEKATKGLFCQMVIIPLFARHRILSQVAGHEMYEREDHDEYTKEHDE